MNHDTPSKDTILSPTNKIACSELIECQTTEFLRMGGKVQLIESGVTTSSKKLKSHWAQCIKQGFTKK